MAPVTVAEASHVSVDVPLSQRRLPALDGLRGVAILLVAVCLESWSFRTAIHESQGWKLQRIWTPHFFRDPNGYVIELCAKRADHVVVLADGRIVEEGTHATLMARGGEYRELYHEQFGEVAGASAPAAGQPGARVARS